MAPLDREGATALGFGRALRYLREQRGVKQAELARGAEVGKSQLSVYENGRRAPSYEVLTRLMGALRADFHDLHNALKIVSGNLDEVCVGHKGTEEGAAAEKFAEGISLLLRASQKST